jgi:hypothetical protein
MILKKDASFVVFDDRVRVRIIDLVREPQARIGLSRSSPMTSIRSARLPTMSRSCA